MKLHRWWKSTLLNTHWWSSRQVPYNKHTQNTKEFFFPKILAEKTTRGQKVGLHPNKWTELLICISEIDVLCSMFELNFDCNPTYIIPDNIKPVVLLIMGVYFVLFKQCNHFSNPYTPKASQACNRFKTGLQQKLLWQLSQTQPAYKVFLLFVLPLVSDQSVSSCWTLSSKTNAENRKSLYKSPFLTPKM